MSRKIPLSERAIKIKELIAEQVGMGTYGLVELELFEFDREIHELKEKLHEATYNDLPNQGELANNKDVPWESMGH